MIWLTWRQFRLQAWVAVALLAVVGIVLAITAPRVFDLYRSTGLSECTGGCDDLADAFRLQASTSAASAAYVLGSAALLLAPPLIGVFWGAPLVSRELETGTHRLIWTQTISRGRWLAVKLAGIGLVAVLAAGLLSLLVTWTSGPFDRAGDFGRITPLLFSSRGVVPLGYAAVAFVLGVAVGMISRRVVVSMAVTLVLVALVQLAAPFGYRSHLVTPATGTGTFSEERAESLWIDQGRNVTIKMEPLERGSWVLSNETVGPDGKTFTGPAPEDKCGRQGSPDKCNAWLKAQNLSQKTEYVSSSAFWTLQWREFGLLLVVAGLLSAFCTWWVRRRLI
ncbi:ABC transporter permease subunit [Actinoplanes sp. LDG1-06]|uniref:ABC transporter permease subunit n=1 Tax=Paractinoplanes ovalisporus TaxID=2810368 RepID=A0ABS2AJM6_9ACTN|nr:ABC transporter permease subunit [Actinoplanes ovalisporus]MBM2620037.1 ABC transporter permease subunit [Actinoplanes ovalisporus]